MLARGTLDFTRNPSFKTSPTHPFSMSDTLFCSHESPPSPPAWQPETRKDSVHGHHFLMEETHA